MRWGYLIPRLLVVTLFWAFMQFGFDPTLRLGGEYGLAAITFRQVRIDDVESRLWPPRLTTGKLEICEDDRLDQAELKAASVRVKIDESALRNRRWVADEVAVEGVEWNIPAEFEEVVAEETSGEAGWADGIRERGAAALTHQLTLLRERLEQRLDHERLETVQLSKEKRAVYEGEYATLRSQVDKLRSRAESYQRLAKDPELQRTVLLDPRRLEAIVEDAKLVEHEVRAVRDQIRDVKDRLPLDYSELKAAKERDLATLKSEWQDVSGNQAELVELFLGGPVATALEQIAVWWPRWQTFQESGDWKEKHVVEGRGRDILFLPSQAGPTAGIRHLLVSGTANASDGPHSFRCDLRDLTYPIVEDQPASFQWVSDGGVRVQAAGLIRLHHDHPQVSVQFRMTDSQPLKSRQTAARGTNVAFVSDAPTLEGTLALGETATGECVLHLPNARAAVRTGNQRYDNVLMALDVNAAALAPRIHFEIGRAKQDVDIECAGLSTVQEAWGTQLTTLVAQSAATLQRQAETYLANELAKVDLEGAEIEQLLAALPAGKLVDVANWEKTPVGRLQNVIRQTAGEETAERLTERVTEKAGGFFKKILR